MIEPLEVSFTRCEKQAILLVVRPTATERFQRKLRALLQARKTFDPKPKGSLADYCRRDAQSWVSNMLHEVRATQPNLDDLENIADFFRVSINELLRPADPKDLSADEQRLVLAFRALPEPTREHFLALLEAASINARVSDKRGQPRAIKLLTTRVGETAVGAPAIRPLSDSATTLHTLQEYLRTLSLELGAVAAGVVPRRDHLSGHAEKPAGH